MSQNTAMPANRLVSALRKRIQADRSTQRSQASLDVVLERAIIQGTQEYISFPDLADLVILNFIIMASKQGYTADEIRVYLFSVLGEMDTK